MNCPHCGTSNDNQSKFCLKCGRPTVSSGNAPKPVVVPPTPSSASPGNPVTRMRSLTTSQPTGPSQPPTQAAQSPPQHAAAPPPPPPASTFQSRPQVNAQQRQTNQPPTRAYSQQQVQQSQYSSNPSSQKNLSALNIWGPFAGYGARRRHLGWLMDGQGSRYQDLTNQIGNRFNKRNIPDVQISRQNLTAKGLLVETRPYFLLKRGLVTLGLKVSVFGNDLFISMATYLKPPISNFRVILFLGAGAFALIGGPILNGILNTALGNISSNLMGGGLFGGSSSGGSDLSGLLMPVMCFFGPLWSLTIIGLYIALFYSFYKWLTEKDFLALLRVKPNEFNEDDLMAMEKAVEQTIRSSLDDIGLNPADLRPAAVQGQEQRLI